MTFASLMAFIAVMIEVRICGCIVPCSSNASSALTTSTGFPASASRLAMSIEVPRGRSGLAAVGDVFAADACKDERVDVVRAAQCGRGRKNAERRSKYLRAGNLIARLVIAEHSRRLEDRLVQGAGKVTGRSATQNAVAG